ncbi:MAG: SurA N-terminal domain-containing protein [Pseudomonadota bacterium]
MLNSLRKSAGSWVAKILIALLVLAFATWGINDVFNSHGPSTVAYVGDKDISSFDFYRAYQDEVRQLSLQLRQRLTPEQIRLLRVQERAINRLVNTATLDLHAETLDLGIPEEMVTQNIFEDPSFQGATGRFSTDAFNRYLQNRSMTERQYISNRKQVLVRNQITTSLVSGLSAPNTLLEAQNIYENETRILKFFDIPLKAIAKIKDPTEDEIKSHYDNNKAQFRAPEYRRISYFVLRPEDIRKTIEIEDETLKESYDSNIAQYTKEENRDIQQISFPDLKSAEAAFKKLKSGKKFEDVAKEAGQKPSDINLGKLTKANILDSTIADEIFKLKKNTFSKPIKGALNTVIARVKTIEPRTVTAFKDVKKQIKNQLALERANEEITTLQDSIEDERGTLELKDIAEKFGLKFQENEVDAKGQDKAGKAIDPFTNAQALLNQVFQSEIGDDNEAIVVNDDVVWFEVTDITLTRIKDFEEVKEKAKENWQLKQQRASLKKKSDELLEALKSGKSIKAVARKVSAKVSTSQPIKRNGTPNKLSRLAIREAFLKPVNAYADAISHDNKSRTIFQVTKIDTPKPPSKETAEGLKSRISPQLANDMILQYVQALQDKYGVNVNHSALETALTAPRGSNRGSN